MGQVILHATMSLDDFIAGPNDEMDWVFKDGGPDQMVDDVMANIGAIVLGSRTFEVALEQNQLPYGGKVQVPQFVVTRERREVEIIGGSKFTFVPEGVERAVELAQAAAGEKNVSLLGASIDQQCLKEGLVDEMVIHLVPILLGKGIRLFEGLGKSIELERTHVVSTSPITSLRFRIVK